MTSDSFDLTKLDTDHLVLRSIKYGKILPLQNFKSIAIHSWNDVAMGRPATGRCGVFLIYFTECAFITEYLIHFFSSSSDCHGCPAGLSNFSSFSGKGCADCGWSFIAISFLIYYFPLLIRLRLYLLPKLHCSELFCMDL